MSAPRQTDHYSPSPPPSPDPGERNALRTTFTKLPHPSNGVHVHRATTHYEWGCDYTVDHVRQLGDRERRDYRNQDFGLFPAAPAIGGAVQRFPQQEVFALARGWNSTHGKPIGEASRSAEVPGSPRPIDFSLLGQGSVGKESVSQEPKCIGGGDVVGAGQSAEAGVETTKNSDVVRDESE